MCGSVAPHLHNTIAQLKLNKNVKESRTLSPLFFFIYEPFFLHLPKILPKLTDWDELD